jgi:hypothetical protein
VLRLVRATTAVAIEIESSSNARTRDIGIEVYSAAVRGVSGVARAIGPKVSRQTTVVISQIVVPMRRRGKARATVG